MCIISIYSDKLSITTVFVQHREKQGEIAPEQLKHFSHRCAVCITAKHADVGLTALQMKGNAVSPLSTQLALAWTAAASVKKQFFSLDN